MESDLKPPLIRAAESNNEREVKRLLDDGVDVNETDDQGKTALFYAAQNDNESIAVLLIKADADVDAKDNQDKTALFYAAANTSIQDACNILVALVEKGEALVNATDIYGRNPLFYAITNSIPIIRYLLDHEADLHAEDNCNVSILTCLLEHCLMKEENPSNLTFLSEVLSLLLERGLERQSIVDSILNLVFCKAPLLLCSDEQETAIPGLLKIRTGDIMSALRRAVQNVDESKSKKKELILEVEEKIESGKIFEALDMLSKLRAKPNSTDSAGNTALHYTTVLPLMGVPQQSVMEICEFLRKKGVHFSKPNHQSQTPLLFCLSANNWKLKGPSNQRSGIKTLVDVCTFLLKNGSKLSETLQNKENVFHLMMKLFQQVFSIHDQVVRENILQELIKLLEVFGGKGEKQGKIGNKHDDSGNAPLHLWATLILPSPQDYSSNICENYTFEKFLKLILDSLLKCGANVNDRNNESETPLHLCKTWTAVKLLINAEANPKDVDLSGRSPLLVAARCKLFLKHPDRFYPDFTDDPKAFWRSALKEGLDPWTADKHGESVLSVLIKADASVLSRYLVKAAACDDVENSICLLKIICKDGDKHWKADLVGDIIKSRKNPLMSLEEPLRLCCENVMKASNANDRREDYEDHAMSSVHYKIAERLILHDANFRDQCLSNLSFRDMAETCPVLKNLFLKPTDINNISKLIAPWNSSSKRYEEILKKVSRGFETKRIKDILYHKDHIAIGGFGSVFVGISEKDGREVAIKRIQNRVVNEQEMKNLTRLADCEQVVRYLYYIPEDEFSYMISELMEGTLDEYLAEGIDKSESVQLCKDVVMGLEFLHDHPNPIIHRDLKPANILYKTHPKLCLKIADFGLSLLIDSSSNEGNDEHIGTRCWRAPEVLVEQNSHSVSSDMFSCGLLLHYILSGKRHPFSKPHCEEGYRSIRETEKNIKNGKMEGWDSSLFPEATHLVKCMLEHDRKKRPAAGEALNHPLFWSNEEKIDLLIAVGSQPEFFEYPRSKGLLPFTPVEEDLENRFHIIVKNANWNDTFFLNMPAIYAEILQIPGSRRYNTRSVVELVRFIQYAHSRVSSMGKQQARIKKMLLENFMFLDLFPNLVIEVYHAVTTHGWDQERQEIKNLMHCDRHQRQRALLSPSANVRLDKDLKGHTPWIFVSKKFENRLSRVASEQECTTVDVYRYHNDHIAWGKFGEIFAGISVNDGREVAIKRIEKSRMHRPEDKREVVNLTTLADCQQVVRYLCFINDENDDFSYVVLELMEGNLDDYLSDTFDPKQSIKLCEDVVMGMKYLHEHNILHRDLKPGNILYKVHPKVCLKIADFGLSRRIDSSGSSTVYSINSGTKCWIAPEVLNSSVDTYEHSESSDMFSCGLVLHYILSVKKHPFSPADCANQTEIQISHEIEANVVCDNKEGWDNSLSPEATHLVLKMLRNCESSRPTAGEVLEHPIFWSKQKKIDFLVAVGNQPEFAIPRYKRSPPLSEVEIVLEGRMSTICEHVTWIDPEYKTILAIYSEMRTKRPYDTSSAVELVRLIRNAYAHVSAEKKPTPMPIIKLLLEDFVFLDVFPKLFIEVYHGVTTFGWSTTRDEIKYTMKK